MAGVSLRSRSPDQPLGPALVASELSPGSEEPTVVSSRRTVGLHVADVLLFAACVLWMTGASAVDPKAMNEYGLLPALPVTFFAGMALLISSIAIVLTGRHLSPVRLTANLLALVVVLHGTVPLIFSQPNYPWVYKHIGVVRYIDLHGGVDPGVDIYQNWPGFFALAAWLTRVSGVSAASIATWAPVYFNALNCLVLAFALRWLPISRRARWLASFLFVAGNWVGQDYYAPQALAFVLSVAVLGMLLAWFRVDRRVPVMRVARRLAGRLVPDRGPARLDTSPEPWPAPMSGTWALAVLFGTFAFLVVTHQLSPYVVILGAGLLTAAGLVRPRWIVLALAAMAIGYLLLRFPYLERTQDLFGSLGDPLRNIHSTQPNDSVPLPGRRLVALAAPALILLMWSLGALGVARRLWQRRPVLATVLLAASPALVAVGQSYGGEAVFRIYLFSLPWVAALGACALERPSRPDGAGSAVVLGLVLALTTALFLAAFYGSEELYHVRTGEVQASQFFYDHAEPGSVLTLTAPNFPTRIGANYDQFARGGDNPPTLLLSADGLRHRMLGPADVPLVEAFVRRYVSSGETSAYLAISRGQQVYAEVMGLLPAGSVSGLDRALAAAPGWDVFYRNGDAVIYRLAAGDDGAPPRPTGALAPPGRVPEEPERSGDSTALVLAGMAGLALAATHISRRRRGRMWTVRARQDDKEEPMDAPTVASTPRSAPDLDKVHALVTASPPDRRESVRRLREEWGPVPVAHLRALLEDARPAMRAAAAGLVDVDSEAIPLLHRMAAEDVNPEVRAAAVEAMGRASQRDQLRVLKAALADSDAAVRALAAGTLPTSGPTAAVAALLGASEDPDEAVRRAAQRRLAHAPSWVLWLALEWCSRRAELRGVLEEEIGRDQLAAVALERMGSPDPADRILALDLCAPVATSETEGAALAALHDPDSSVRRAAIGRLAGSPDALDELIGIVRDDPDPSVRLAAVTALDAVAHDRAQSAIIAALDDPSLEVRRHVTDSLVARASLPLAQRLVHLLTPRNASTVGSVLLRMGRPGEDALASALVSGPPELADVAGDLIRRIERPQRFVEDLRALDPAVRLRAVEVLGARRDVSYVDDLAAALLDVRPEVRSRAVVHLGRIGGERALTAIHDVLETDHHPDVVRAACQALLPPDHATHNGRASFVSPPLRPG